VVQGVAGRAGGFTKLGFKLMPKKELLKLQPTKVVQCVAGMAGGFTKTGHVAYGKEKNSYNCNLLKVVQGAAGRAGGYIKQGLLLTPKKNPATATYQRGPRCGR
jgi:hypothetical protein